MPPSNFAFLNNFSQSSLDIPVIFDFEALDYSAELTERELILFQIMGARGRYFRCIYFPGTYTRKNQLPPAREFALCDQ
jgi:hypothetical protein